MPLSICLHFVVASVKKLQLENQSVHAEVITNAAEATLRHTSTRYIRVVTNDIHEKSKKSSGFAGE